MVFTALTRDYKWSHTITVCKRDKNWVQTRHDTRLMCNQVHLISRSMTLSLWKLTNCSSKVYSKFPYQNLENLFPLYSLDLNQMGHTVWYLTSSLSMSLYNTTILKWTPLNRPFKWWSQAAIWHQLTLKMRTTQYQLLKSTINIWNLCSMVHFTSTPACQMVCPVPHVYSLNCLNQFMHPYIHWAISTWGT